VIWKQTHKNPRGCQTRFIRTFVSVLYCCIFGEIIMCKDQNNSNIRISDDGKKIVKFSEIFFGGEGFKIVDNIVFFSKYVSISRLRGGRVQTPWSPLICGLEIILYHNIIQNIIFTRLNLNLLTILIIPISIDCDDNIRNS